MSKRFSVLAATAVSVCLPSMGFAQEAAGERVALEEVIVTAQKREEKLQDVPMAVQAFDENALAKMGFANFVDIGSKAPALNIQPYYNSTSTLRVYMRGIGQENPDDMTRDSGVGVYLDDVYVAHGNGLAVELSDVQRIEVLPGPQGVLYGRNSVGGAVKFISAAPTGEFGFKQSFDFGNFGHFRSTSNLNLPAVANISAKLSFLKSKSDGWVNNPGSGDDFGSKDQTGYRIALRWQPADSFTADYVFDHTSQEGMPLYMQLQYLAPVLSPALPNRYGNYYPKRQSTAWRPVTTSRDDFTSAGHALTLAWQISDLMTLKAVSAYRRFDSVAINDSVESYNDSSLVAMYSDQDQFSQELLLSGNTSDSQIKYHVGAYYYTESADQVSASAAAARAAIGARVPYVGPLLSDLRPSGGGEIENRSKAIYANVTYIPQFLDSRVSFDIGGRKSWDDRAYNRELPTPDGESVEASSFDPSFTVDYKWTDALHTYAKYAEGYRSGGYSLGNTNVTSFDPEHVKSYEIGLKSMWLQDRLRFNIDAFREKYQDIQLSYFNSNFTAYQTTNAGNATIEGVEGEIQVAAAQGLELAGRFTYMTYEALLQNPFTLGTPTVLLPQVPKWKYNLSADYTFAPLSFGTLSAGVAYDYHGTDYSSTTARKGIDERPGYGLIDARLTLADIGVGGKGALSVSLWGKNLTDKEYFYYYNLGAVTFGQPRNYGVNLTYKY